MRRMVFALSALCSPALLACSALAVDIPVPSPEEFPADASPEAHWVWGLVVTIGLPALGWLARMVDAWIRERGVCKRYAAARELYGFAAYGAERAYKTFARELKAGKENDGKLTEAEKREAMAIAVREARDYACGQGVDLLKRIAPAALELLIEKVIGDRKAGNILAAPFTRLPDLSPSAPSV